MSMMTAASTMTRSQSCRCCTARGSSNFILPTTASCVGGTTTRTELRFYYSTSRPTSKFSSRRATATPLCSGGAATPNPYYSSPMRSPTTTGPVVPFSSSQVGTRNPLSSIAASLFRRSLEGNMNRYHYSTQRDPPCHNDHDQDVLAVDSCWPNCSQPLGEPLPLDEHACSVSLPTWSAVVGYEEGDPTITSAMKCGYPRFVYHPYVLQLMQLALELHGHSGEDCLVLPSYQAAHRCQRFLIQALTTSSQSSSSKHDAVLDNAWDVSESNSSEDNDAATTASTTTTTTTISNQVGIRMINLNAANVHIVFFPAQTRAGMEAKAYWQHTGEIVSSRRAEQALVALGQSLQTRVTPGPHIRHTSACGNNETSNTVESTTTTAENDDTTTGSYASSPFVKLRERIGTWANVPPEHVFLTPSGMSAIYTALRSARRYKLSSSSSSSTSTGGGGRSIVFGFPYLDTLKLCSRVEFCPDGVEFFGLGNLNDVDNLEQLLQQQQQQRSSNNNYCALFTEVPSNPLLQCPDLIRLRQLANQYDFALIVDDTIGNFLNVNLLQSGLADAVCTSLTKLVSGRGDAMAGSVVANPHTKLGQWMQHDLMQLQRQSQRQSDDPPATAATPDGSFGLFAADAQAVLLNSIDFVERNDRINANAEGLADWLHDHPDVDQVYYPKLSAPLYQQHIHQHPGTGSTSGRYGGLMSITLPPHMCQRTFYDSLNVAKGPSLGTNYTLVCPYTLLAHYHELDFAISCNVPPNLLRISVGLEDLDELKVKFERAFQTSRLHPKVCLEGLQKRAYSTATAATRSTSTSSYWPMATRLSTLIR